MTAAIPTDALAAVLDELRESAPGLRVLTDPVDRESYRLDETDYLTAGLPGAIALPTTTAQVSAILAAATRHRLPVVPRGAGTGLSGGAAGIDGALTMSLMRMDRILDIDVDNLCAVVQPGVINADLKKAVAQHGLFYPPDPASYESSSIGGNLGTNAGGLCCVKYGQTRDWVLALEVVLADGTVIRTGGKTVKDTAGYSLTHLIVGSQGTLGVITEATLRLRPLPGPRSTLLAFFPSLVASGEAVAAMTRSGMVPVTLELLDHETILAVDDAFSLGLHREAASMLLVESDAPGAAAAAEMDAAEAACTGAGASSVVRAADAAEADWLRQARRLAFDALERRGTVRMSEDVAVPRSKVPDLLAAIERIATAHGVTCATFGHAGDGNLHPHLLFDRDDPEAMRRSLQVQDEMLQATLDLGGTVSAEHGVGVVRKAWLPRQRGDGAVAAMRAIKRALDPLGILNPGRVL
ncbi:MAG TPA: FAD-linked oxidase C-terminal domain-containing protein [Candidatus Limnocylindrales bacterium]|nr:FAD-linked oxidase C-terminal domain-containing protein [Candidatus Limnocylindrales bacterium]